MNYGEGVMQKCCCCSLTRITNPVVSNTVVIIPNTTTTDSTIAINCFFDISNFSPKPYLTGPMSS